MAKNKAKAADAQSSTVRLYRLADKFITDPMTPEYADEIMDGYPGEYEVYNPNNPTPAADNGDEVAGLASDAPPPPIDPDPVG